MLGGMNFSPLSIQLSWSVSSDAKSVSYTFSNVINCLSTQKIFFLLLYDSRVSLKIEILASREKMLSSTPKIKKIVTKHDFRLKTIMNEKNKESCELLLKVSQSFPNFRETDFVVVDKFSQRLQVYKRKYQISSSLTSIYWAYDYFHRDYL